MIREAEILAKTYKDTAIVKRYQQTKIEHETKMVLTQIDDTINCGYSNSSVSKMNIIETAEMHKVQFYPSIFCLPDTDIQAGDVITVTLQTGKVMVFKAGDPGVYISHMEVPLFRDGEA